MALMGAKRLGILGLSPDGWNQSHNFPVFFAVNREPGAAGRLRSEGAGKMLANHQRILHCDALSWHSSTKGRMSDSRMQSDNGCTGGGKAKLQSSSTFADFFSPRRLPQTHRGDPC